MMNHQYEPTNKKSGIHLPQGKAHISSTLTLSHRTRGWVERMSPLLAFELPFMLVMAR